MSNRKGEIEMKNQKRNGWARLLRWIGVARCRSCQRWVLIDLPERRMCEGCTFEILMEEVAVN